MNPDTFQKLMKQSQEEHPELFEEGVDENNKQVDEYNRQVGEYNKKLMKIKFLIYSLI